MLYQVIREMKNGRRQFVGLPKGYKTKEEAIASIEVQKNFEKHLKVDDEYSSRKFFIRTYELVSEEEIVNE